MTNPKLHVHTPRNLMMISIEGIDGVGKSSQAKMVTTELIRRGINAKRLSSPSGTIVGKFLRENMRALKPWERASFFMIDSIGLLIENNDYPGIIVWDRYKDSNMVSNKDMNPSEAKKWADELPDPKVTFLLDMPTEAIIAKRPSCIDEHWEQKDWMDEKRRRYLDLAASKPERIVLLDADRDPLLITTEIVGRIVRELAPGKANS